MTVTADLFFYMSLVWFVSYVILELRAQKIAKTLSGNLVTLFTRNEGSTETMVGLWARQATITDGIAAVLKDAQEDRKILTDLVQNDLDEIKRQVRTLSDNEQQAHAVIDSIIDDVLKEKLEGLEEAILNKVRTDIAAQVAALVKGNGDGTGFNLDQLLEVIKNGGAVMDKLGPIADIFAKVRNGTAKAGQN